MQTRRVSGWIRSLVVCAAGASIALLVQMLWSALHAPADIAIKRGVTIGTAVAAGVFVGDTLRPDPRLRRPARALYTALGALVAACLVGALTKEWG